MCSSSNWRYKICELLTLSQRSAALFLTPCFLDCLTMSQSFNILCLSCITVMLGLILSLPRSSLPLTHY